MSRKRFFYGVLNSDAAQDVTRDTHNYGETRMVLRDEEGQDFTVVTEFNGNGYFTLTIEGENRDVLGHYSGNVYDLLKRAQEG